MTRTPLIAANWKMNDAPEGAFDPESPFRSHSAVDVWVFPTALDIKEAHQMGLIVGAQRGHSQEDGAHTGSMSMRRIEAEGCRTVLCGHSESRVENSESNDEVAKQAIEALEHGLHPVVCVGETIEEREAGKTKEVIAAQLEHLPVESDMTIAYEPVWAIGVNGTPATPEDAEEVHAFIRESLPEDRRDTMRILYGGSMKPGNAEALLSMPNIDGGLIGGCSLKPDEFQEIVDIALKLAS